MTVADRPARRRHLDGRNPFDLFGDNLRAALRAPATYQLLEWLEAAPGAQLPQGETPPEGALGDVGWPRRFGRELTADLRAAGLDVTVIESRGMHDDVIEGDASELGVLEQASLDTAIGLVAERTTTRRICRSSPMLSS